jgi:hypothetical protein
VTRGKATTETRLAQPRLASIAPACLETACQLGLKSRLLCKRTGFQQPAEVAATALRTWCTYWLGSLRRQLPVGLCQPASCTGRHCRTLERVHADSRNCTPCSLDVANVLQVGTATTACASKQTAKSTPNFGGAPSGYAPTARCLATLHMRPMWVCVVPQQAECVCHMCSQGMDGT